MAQIRLIGTDPSQVPTNGMLGNLAFQNAESVSLEKLVVTGDVGIGTLTPASRLEIVGNASSDSKVTFSRVPVQSSNDGVIGELFFQNNTDSIALISVKRQSAADDAYIQFATQQSGGGLTERLRITSTGNVGIGTTSPNSTLTVNGSARVQNAASFAGISIQNNNDSSVVTTTSFFDVSNNLGTIDGHLFFEHLTTGGCNAVIGTTPAGDRAVDRRASRLTVGFNGTTTLNSAASTAPFIAQIASAEAARIDSSGRLLVGTSSSRNTAIGGAALQVEGTTYGGSSMQMICNSAADAVTCSHLAFGRSKTTSIGGTGQVENGDRLGAISWNGAQNSTLSSIAGLIECYVDGEVQTAGDTTDMPGRLVFSTTADGAASPTERLRITSDGNLLVTGGFLPTNTSRLVVRGFSSGTYNNTFSQTNATAQIISNEMSAAGWHPTFNIAMVRQSLTTGQNAFGGIGFSTIDDSNSSGMFDAGRIAIVNENGNAVASGTAMAFYTQVGSATNTDNATERLRITSTGTLNLVGAGTAGSTQAVSFSGSAPVNSLVLDSSGRVGIGNASPLTKLHINLTGSAVTPIVNVGSFGASGVVSLGGIANNSEKVYLGTGEGVNGGVAAGIGFEREADGWNTALSFYTNNVTSGPNGVSAIQEKMRITSAGKVGIGTTTPTNTDKLEIQTSSNSAPGLWVQTGGTTSAHPIADFKTGSNVSALLIRGDGASVFTGKVLVGTSTARANFYNGANSAQIQLEGTNYQSAAFAIVCNANSDDKGSLILAKNRGTTVGSNTIVQDGDDLGSIEFQGSDGAEFVQAAAIKAEVDGTPGANDMPGRLVFSTTADGAASPTERMRINSAGAIGLTGANYGTTGQVLTSNGSAAAPTWQAGGGGVDSIEVMLFG